MSLVDDIATRVKTSTGQNTMADGVIDSVVAYLNDPANGGLQGLLAKCQSGGLGAQIQSWIGTGNNLPVTPAQVTQLLGDDHVARVATSAGITRDEASEQLSAVLPHVIDHLTPTGELPSADGVLDQLSGNIRSKLSS